MLALIQQYKLIAIGLIVSALMALSAAGAWNWQANKYELRIAVTERDQAAADSAAQARARVDEQLRQHAIEGIRQHAHDQVIAATADAVAADTAADSLREQVAKLARRPARCPGVATGSETADPERLLLADVLIEVERAGRELAAYADRARLAGAACELSFDAVRGGGK